jgi:hypothetical protein
MPLPSAEAQAGSIFSRSFQHDQAQHPQDRADVRHLHGPVPRRLGRARRVALGPTPARFHLPLHFISPPYQVGDFDPTTAVALVGVTFTLGTVGAGVFAAVWNIAVRK